MGVFFSLPLCFAKREAWGTLRFPQHKNSSKAAQVPVPSYSKYSWGTHFTPDCPLSHSLSTFPQRFIQPAAKRHLPPPRGVRGGGRVLHCACTCFPARPRARAFRHEWLSGARGRGESVRTQNSCGGRRWRKKEAPHFCAYNFRRREYSPFAGMVRGSCVLFRKVRD